LTFATTPSIRQLEPAAASVFWNIEGNVRPGKGFGPDGGLRFLEWLLCDYTPRRGEGTLLGSFADAEFGLDPREADLLLASLLSPVRAHEVTDAIGARIMVTDVLSGGQYALGPIGLPYRPIRSDLLICRTLHLVRVTRPGASYLVLPAACREELLAYLRSAYRLVRPTQHTSFEDFLDGSAHLYHHYFLSRGRNVGARAVETLRPVAFAPGRVIFSGQDLRRIRAALDRQPDLERGEAEGDEVRYAYIDSERAITRATVFVRLGQVDLRANSREDLSAARVLLETCLRGLIHPMEEQPCEPSDSPTDETRGPAVGMRGESFYSRFLHEWADTPNLTLDTHTPREAVQFGAEREQVIHLLANLERDMARQKRLGRAWADLTALREQLGLSPATAPGPRRKKA
jgi:hypothetical protein